MISRRHPRKMITDRDEDHPLAISLGNMANPTSQLSFRHQSPKARQPGTRPLNAPPAALPQAAEKTHLRAKVKAQSSPQKETPLSHQKSKEKNFNNVTVGPAHRLQPTYLVPSYPSVPPNATLSTLPGPNGIRRRQDDPCRIPTSHSPIAT